MALEDILPITSMGLIIIGVLIILFATIWLAHLMADTDHHTTDDIIDEMNQMFAYFTSQIHEDNQDIKGQNPQFDQIAKGQNEYYNDVIKYKEEGKTPGQIAKILDIGIGEVNLILGIAQMR